MKWSWFCKCIFKKSSKITISALQFGVAILDQASPSIITIKDENGVSVSLAPTNKLLNESAQEISETQSDITTN